jgi:hypothetical protein
MNAFKHGLTGQSLMLQPNEMEAHNRLTTSMLSDLKPRTEPERQLAQKIIDGHFRLNRLAGVENNMFNFGLIQHTTDTDHDDRVEVMVAQTRAWIEQSHAFVSRPLRNPPLASAPQVHRVIRAHPEGPHRPRASRTRIRFPWQTP